MNNQPSGPSFRGAAIAVSRTHSEACVPLSFDSHKEPPGALILHRIATEPATWSSVLDFIIKSACMSITAITREYFGGLLSIYNKSA